MNQTNARRLACGLMMTGIWAVESNGQDPETDLVDELQWLRAERVTVRTATLREESIAHAPATIRVVTREQIRNRGYRSLYELLRDQPGIDILDHAQAESKHRFTIRGITGNHKFIILQDGVRINSPTGENIQPVAENYPLYHVRQVEILLGPASALYGADAFTAVINLITEDPTPEGRFDSALEVGEFGQRRLDAYGARRYTDRFALSAGGHYQDADAPNLRKEYPAAFPFDDLKNFDGSLAVPLAERNEYTGAFRSFSTWLKVEIGDDLVIGWNQSLFRSRYSESVRSSATDYEEYGDTLLLTGYGRYTCHLSERLSGQWVASYSRYEQLPESRFNNQVSGFTDAYKYSLGESFRIEPRLTYVQDDRHVYTGGLLFERIHAIPHTADLTEQYRRDKGPDGQNQFHPGSDGTLPIEIFNIWYNNIGGFLQHQGQWTPKLSSTLGARYDYSEDYGGSFNPRLGLVHETSERTTWKALYGKAFLAPSPFERYENFGAFAFRRPDGVYQSFFFHVPNPNLEPEELQTIELGVSHRPIDDLTIGLVGFYTTIDDLILNAATPEPVRDFVPGGDITFTEASQNIGESEAYGGELTIEQTVRAGVSRFDTWASYTLLDGHLDNRLTDVRTDLPFTSKQMARVGVTWNYAERLVSTLSLRWNGPQTGFAADPNVTIETGEFTVADLYAELRNRTRRRALFVRITNLFDERYENAGRDLAFLQDYNPQDPRWITGGVRLTF